MIFPGVVHVDVETVLVGCVAGCAEAIAEVTSKAPGEIADHDARGSRVRLGVIARYDEQGVDEPPVAIPARCAIG